MISFFLNKKYPIYRAEYENSGAGETVVWSLRDKIMAKIEPFEGESFRESTIGDDEIFSLIMYSKSEIMIGDRIYLNNRWFEVRKREFYQMPFIEYWKGFLVKTDEKISI